MLHQQTRSFLHNQLQVICGTHRGDVSVELRGQLERRLKLAVAPRSLHAEKRVKA